MIKVRLVHCLDALRHCHRTGGQWPSRMRPQVFLHNLALIAFLSNGDVWTIPEMGGSPTRVTHTGGLVDDFRYSFDGRYLAYTKRIGQDDGAPINAIIVTKANSRDLLTELKSTEGSLNIDRWLGTTLVYHVSTPLEVNGVFEYDVVHAQRRELDLSTPVSPLDRDVTIDGSLLVYVDDTGLGPTFRHRLHTADSNGVDIVRASRRSILRPSLSTDRRSIAYVEVYDSARAQSTARDRVWVVLIDSLNAAAVAVGSPAGAARELMIYEGSVRAKSGSDGLAWSPDDRYLSMSIGGQVVVLHSGMQRPPVLAVSGSDACWSKTGALVVAQTAGIVRFDVTTTTSRVIVPRGSRPQCVM